MGLLYRLGKRIILFAIFFLVIVFLPGLPPKTTFDFKEIEITPSRNLSGPFELNNHLDNTERLLEGRVYGPEALIARKNELYTTVHGGEVIKITAEHITHVAKFGKPCVAVYEESKCGRPLGLVFDTLGNNLIVADAYYGIWQVDLSNGRKQQFIAPDQVLEGKVNRPAKIFNSVVVSKNGDIYWTDSSSDFSIENGIYTLLAQPSGRVFHYNRRTNENKMLLDEINFANGIILSPNEEFLLIAETGASRILKYNLQGSRKGQKEVFIDGLPGSPDNLTPDLEGFWIPLVIARDNDNPAFSAVIAPFPMLRCFILRLFALFELPFRLVNNAFPNSYTQKVLHFVGHFEMAKILFPKRTTILRADWNGNIIGSLHGFDGTAGFVSHALELGDSLFLGSPFNKFLGKIKLPRGPQIKIRNVKVEGMEPIMSASGTEKPIKTSESTLTQKPVESTTQKTVPTTTTPKPTTKLPKTVTTRKPEIKKESIPTMTSTTTLKPKTTTAKPPSQADIPKPTISKPKTTTTTTTQTTPKPKISAATTTPPPRASTTPTTFKPQVPPTIKTTTSKPTQPKRDVPTEPAPINEDYGRDTKPPKAQKLKVIKKSGEQGEL